MEKGVILRLFRNQQLRPLAGGCRRRTPMGESIKAESEGKAEIRFDRETIERTIRERVREIIEGVVEAELDAALGGRAVRARRRRSQGVPARVPRAYADH
jgi:hypothetical protein